MNDMRTIIPDAIILDAPDPIHPDDFPETTDCPISCNSWVVYHPSGTFETYDRKLAVAAFFGGVEVKTAYDHLVSLNGEREHG